MTGPQGRHTTHLGSVRVLHWRIHGGCGWGRSSDFLLELLNWEYMNPGLLVTIFLGHGENCLQKELPGTSRCKTERRGSTKPIQGSASCSHPYIFQGLVHWYWGSIIWNLQGLTHMVLLFLLNLVNTWYHSSSQNVHPQEGLISVCAVVWMCAGVLALSEMGGVLQSDVH